MSSSAAILRYIEAAIAPLVRANGGGCDIAADEESALALLATGPRSWRVVLQFDGRGEQDDVQIALSPWRFVAWVQSARGMAVNQGQDVHQTRPGGAPPMLDLVDAVDGWIRALVFGDRVPGVQCPGARATGGQWVPLGNDRTRQHRLGYELTAGMPVSPRFQPPEP